MSEQIVFGRIYCRKCGEMLEMYASTPGIMRQQFERIAQLLETHWENDCQMPTDPEAYLRTTTPITEDTNEPRKEAANG